ncbi:MAG TPA: Crp/Fnr family transcriptional regulator [Candidatus Hydrogenedens sp.]|nr:Crp/Fnr family transcriptional regulator [Candidatus Hydrogenedens sp.]HOL20114.1 Crp/Fnr family transcriptional regulator [Candidatus Hydrogenedens sp.]HPP58664.1 Crp/Fnr family transcriptional regulator [Candidatus Hydrogenedens sp.]
MPFKDTIKDVDKLLEKDKFFHDSSGSLLEKLKNILKLRTYDKNQIIYFPRDDTQNVYIVHNGKIRITRVMDRGKSVTFRHAVAGDVFGEEGIIDKKYREDYAEAIIKSNVWIIPLKEFKDLIQHNPHFSKLYEIILLKRCKEYEELLADTLFYPILVRVARKIIRELKKEGSTNKRVIITHQELANMLCSRRETISTCLQILEKDGYIQKQKGSIIIKKSVELEHWVNKFSV